MEVAEFHAEERVNCGNENYGIFCFHFGVNVVIYRPIYVSLELFVIQRFLINSKYKIRIINMIYHHSKRITFKELLLSPDLKNKFNLT